MRAAITSRGHLPSVRLLVLDGVVGLLLAAGAVAYATSLTFRAPAWIALVSCVACTTTVAWRRRAPAAAVAVTVAAMVVYQRATGDSNMVLEPLAIVLTFYMLGRRARDRSDRVTAAALVGATMAAGAAIAANSHGISALGGVLSLLPPAVIPIIAGMVIARRASVTSDLAEATSLLRSEQRTRSELAATQERNRVAREFHDVVAHGLSVMVIQASAARLVARDDRVAAQNALAVVAGVGRDAMTDLRRIMGVLRHEDDALEAGRLGIAQLAPLLDRVRAGGLDAELHVRGRPAPVPAAVDLAVYRIVQESLTNVVKHAGSTRVSVLVEYAPSALEVEVADAGPVAGCVPAPAVPSGHGLPGMRERVAVLGGELTVGPRASGGWLVRARVPLTAPIHCRAAAPREPSAASGGPADPSRAGTWLDPVFATALLLAFEVEVATSPYRVERLALEGVIAAAMAIAVVWRRRAPLAFLAVVGLLAVSLNRNLVSLDHSTVIGAFLVLVPTYTVAAWEEPRPAGLGLGLWIAVSFTIAWLGHARAGDLLGATTMGCVVWIFGRVAFAQRRLTSELTQTQERLREERGDRISLATAAERARIARELHGLVARRVIEMIVHAESARSLVATDADAAVAAAAAVEHVGRDALAEMRQILGALRAAGGPAMLEPLPGLDQIHGLVERSQAGGRAVGLSIDGRPGPAFAGVDLATYRIVEEILETVDSDVAIAMRFDEDHVELDLSASGIHASASVRKRVALCGGDLIAHNDRVLICLPRQLERTAG